MKPFLLVLLGACLAFACIGCSAGPLAVEGQGNPSDGSAAAVQEQPSSSSGHVARPQGAAPSAAPAALEEDPAFDSMKTQVEKLVNESNIDVGVAFIDLRDAARSPGFSVHGDMPLVSASMIKLLVLAEFLDEVEAGTLSMDDTYTLAADDIVGGTGSVQSAAVGTVYTLGELARLMICDSDNVATNILIERMGMDAINAQAEKLGLENTHLSRLMMSDDAQVGHVENAMSATDAANMLARIWRGQLVSEQASAFALEALEAQTDSSGIAQGLPRDVMFAHKTGTLSQVKNDAGIVEIEGKPYVLAVFCSGGDSSASLELIAEISKTVYGRFG